MYKLKVVDLDAGENVFDEEIVAFCGSVYQEDEKDPVAISDIRWIKRPNAINDALLALEGVEIGIQAAEERLKFGIEATKKGFKVTLVNIKSGEIIIDTVTTTFIFGIATKAGMGLNLCGACGTAAQLSLARESAIVGCKAMIQEIKAYEDMGND